MIDTKRLVQNLAIAAIGVGVILALVDRGAPPAVGAVGAEQASQAAEAGWSDAVEQEGDHIKAVDLADRMLAGTGDLALVDVRPPDEYAAWHLPGALNLTVPQMLGAEGASVLDGSAGKLVVLYSNGMVHPAQAWVELARRGHTNVRILEGGLTELKRDVLTPPSLRGPISEARAAAELPRFQAARELFLGPASGARGAAAVVAQTP